MEAVFKGGIGRLVHLLHLTSLGWSLAGMTPITFCSPDPAATVRAISPIRPTVPPAKLGLSQQALLNQTNYPLELYILLLLPYTPSTKHIPGNEYYLLKPAILCPIGQGRRVPYLHKRA